VRLVHGPRHSTPAGRSLVGMHAGQRFVRRAAARRTTLRARCCPS